MVIYLGADHRGFAHKEAVKEFLKDQGYEVVDCGSEKQDPEDDYPDFGVEVARRVAVAPDQGRGVLICGSGVGMDVVANKVKRVRSVLALSPDQVVSARSHDAVNVLSIAADFVSPEDAKRLVSVFLATPYDRGAAHTRRLEKIAAIEDGQ